MRRGFSLVEVMVVVAIAGVMASLSVGLGSAFVQRQRAQEDIERVRSLLVGARNHARRNAACVKVNRTSNKVLTAVLFEDASLGCPAAPQAVPPSSGLVELRASTSMTPLLVLGVEVSSLIFLPDGSLALSEPATIGVTDIDGRTTPLFIWPAAGVVKQGKPT